MEYSDNGESSVEFNRSASLRLRPGKRLESVALVILATDRLSEGILFDTGMLYRLM